MDLHDKDDSKHQRQENLARRIGRALDEMDAHNAAQCPDGEILAAYAERGLSQADAEKWESHFATCARCRKILQVLAVSADTPLAEKEVAHLGELVAAMHTPAQSGISNEAEVRSRSVIPIWQRRWVGPAIGVAAVLVVWVVMRPPWRTSQQRPPENLIAQAPKEELPPSPAPLEAAPSSPESEQAQDKKAEAAPPVKTESAPPAEQQRSLAQAQPQNAPAAPPAAARDESSDKRLSAKAQAKRGSPATAAAAPTAGAAQGSGAADAVTGPKPAPSPALPPSTSQTVTVTEATPLVETTNGTLAGPLEPGARADLPLNGRNFQSLARLQGASASPLLLKAPGSPVVWRAGKGGSIERSNDAGKTWAPQTSPSQQDWLAGAAFSDKVCWLTGAKGAIARTVDGARWDLIAPPAQAAASGGGQPDWAAVTALDALNATITAADGRKFNTPDGGLTWQPE